MKTASILSGPPVPLELAERLDGARPALAPEKLVRNWPRVAYRQRLIPAILISTVVAEWSVWRPDWQLALLAVIAAILFLPKLLGIALITNKWGEALEFGDLLRLCLSVFLEIIVSSLLAPNPHDVPHAVCDCLFDVPAS